MIRILRDFDNYVLGKNIAKISLVEQGFLYFQKYVSS